MQSVNSSRAPESASREVRVERWTQRAFYATQCRFFIDVPLDMTGMINGAIREANARGIKLRPGGTIFATDAIYRGAVLVELDSTAGVPDAVHLDTEVLARALPPKGIRLRAELDELVRWSLDLGYEVTGCYVQYEATGTIPGSVRATQVFATVRGEHIDSVR